jgi:hypothetical protein
MLKIGNTVVRTFAEIRPKDRVICPDGNVRAVQSTRTHGRGSGRWRTLTFTDGYKMDAAGLVRTVTERPVA